MTDVSDEVFQDLINQAMESLPGEHVRQVKNVAILYEYVPSPEQRVKLELRSNETLLGLYEGVPLSQRQGVSRVFPDKITLFKQPMLNKAKDLNDLKKIIRHTLWHEIAHYYGLNHEQIHELEK